jgi:hypothetical protein
MLRWLWRVLALLILLPIAAIAAAIMVDELNRSYPTRLFCGSLVETAAEAEAIARAHNAPAAMYRTSADPNSDWSGDFGEAPDRNGCAVEYWVQVKRCGGGFTAWKTRVYTPQSSPPVEYDGNKC